MVIGVIGVNGLCVINLVITEVLRKLECVTTQTPNMVEKNAKGNHWKQRDVIFTNAKVRGVSQWTQSYNIYNPRYNYQDILSMTIP